MKSVIIILMFACQFLLAQEDGYQIIVDEVPAPVGGYEEIAKQLTYPPMAVQLKTEGKVYLLLYINEKGSVDDVKVVKGIGAGCDEAAQQAVKKVKFTPGKLKGQSVKTKLTIPITFKLN